MYSFGRAALLLLVEVQNHTVPVRERRRIRVNAVTSDVLPYYNHQQIGSYSSILPIFCTLRLRHTAIRVTSVCSCKERVMFVTTIAKEATPMQVTLSNQIKCKTLFFSL